MKTLALDVDGVLLDPDRRGDGHWTNALERRFGIARPDLRDAFFAGAWNDVVNGRRAVESALAEALAAMGSTAPLDEVIACWFDADFVPVAPVVDLARRAAEAGVRVVLVTNQEHRRAAYLRERLRALFPLHDVVYSAELGVQKHESRFFELASARLGADGSDGPRADIVFADDVQVNVDRAREAGWSAVLATTDLVWIADVERLLGLRSVERRPE